MGVNTKKITLQKKLSAIIKKWQKEESSK